MRGTKLPVTPPQMHNHGNFIVSLGALCAWLAPQAEALGVEIYPGFAAAEPLYDSAGAVRGVRIGDMGVAKDGSHKPGYTQGIDIVAPITVLAEGCRGHLSKQLIAKYRLDADSDPQTYGIGIKELWQLPAGRVTPGKVVHTLGWPLDNAHLWRQFSLSPRQGSRRDRVRHRTRLCRHDAVAVRSVPATQAPSDDQAAARRRQHRLGGCARHCGRRLAVAAEGARCLARC